MFKRRAGAWNWTNFRVDRLELSEKAQEEILQRWKQIPRTPATNDEARAQKLFLDILRQYGALGSFDSDANRFFAMFQTCSQIIGIVRGRRGEDGMRDLRAALDDIYVKIYGSDEAARKLPEALKNLQL